MRITKGVLLLLLAAFVGVALASIHDEDWGAFWKVKNLCGPIGAAIAGSLHVLFGPVLSWFWPFFIVFLAVLVFRQIEARSQIRRIICSVILLVIISAIVSAFGGESAGGRVGVKALSFLRLISGHIGSGLILVAALLVVSFLLLPGAVKARSKHPILYDTYLGQTVTVYFPRLWKELVHGHRGHVFVSRCADQADASRS